MAARLRKLHTLPVTVTGRAALARRLTRIAALCNLLYLGGWYSILAPILQSQVEVYNAGLDGWIRIIQFAAIVPLASAAIGLWNVWHHVQSGCNWSSKVCSVVVVRALLAIAWIAVMGNLIGFNLNY